MISLVRLIFALVVDSGFVFKIRFCIYTVTTRYTAPIDSVSNIVLPPAHLVVGWLCYYWFLICN